MSDQIRKQAEAISEEIIQKVGNYIRYQVGCWPKEADFLDMKRLIKSIVVVHLSRINNERV